MMTKHSTAVHGQASRCDMSTERLTYFDLEGDIHNALNMAQILLDRLHDHFQARGADGCYRIDEHSAGLSLFAAGVAVEKAEAVLARWKKVHASNGGE